MLDLKQKEGKKSPYTILEVSFCLISLALRRIDDTKSRLEAIHTKQRQLNASVSISEKDRRTNQSMSKVSVCT